MEIRSGAWTLWTERPWAVNEKNRRGHLLVTLQVDSQKAVGAGHHGFASINKQPPDFFSNTMNAGLGIPGAGGSPQDPNAACIVVGAIKMAEADGGAA